MFGLIKPYIPELKVKENEYYRAVYCGLCRCIGKETSRLARLALSYDWVFLAMVRGCIFNEKATVTKTRCGMNPFKKRNAVLPTPQMMFTAGAACHLIWYKALDDMHDSRGLAKIKSYTSYILAKRIKKKAPPMPETEALIEKQLAEIRRLENERCPSVDALADAFGLIMAHICSHGVTDEIKRQAAYETGLHTGRFIYIADAVKDYTEDKKTHSYNPFICREVSPFENGDIPYRALCMESSRTYSGILLLSEGIGGAVCENIAQLGMIHVANEICNTPRKD